MKRAYLSAEQHKGFTRRDFLKLAGLASLTPLLNMAPSMRAQSQSQPNLFIFLFDAMSARNLSLYGYPRKTCPNLEKFADRAIVYHNHHSAATFTTPSTASLFAGTYPWTHRAFNLGSLILPSLATNNLFLALPEAYHQAAFAQNVYADIFLYQCNQHMAQHERIDSFALVHSPIYTNLFPKDVIYGLRSYNLFLFPSERANASLFLSILNDLEIQVRNQVNAQRYATEYPDGLPRLATTDVYYRLEQVVDGIIDLVSNLPAPSFLYAHLLPPHEPYAPSRPFLGMFDDGWSPPAKKEHPLSTGKTKQQLDEKRKTYDEFIADLDDEFGRVLDHMESAGLLENSYVILTSDHGEMFERGVLGHSSPLVFEPGIHIPLLISAPGQRQRKDIHTLTSNVDLLPTLLQLAGAPIPDWCEGCLLPGLGGEEMPERSIYVVQAKENPARSPLHIATVALIKGSYKLVHYFGYSNYPDEYELYNLENDPEELDNLYESHPLAKELQAELEQKIHEADQPYQQT